MSSNGMLTFTCLDTSRISDALLIPFFSCKALGKCGGTCLFITSPLITIFSESSFNVESWFSFLPLLPFFFHLISSLFSVSFSIFVSSCGLGVGNPTSLPLLRVIMALTSLTCEDSPSWASTSWIPLGFWWGWEGNFPFSYTVLRLVSLEIEYWRLSIFRDKSFYIPSILLFNVFSTLSILWLSWALIDF